MADLSDGLLAAVPVQGGGGEIAGSAKLIGWLYGLNTLGAGVGGWHLIGAFGFDRAVYVGAALNLVVAVGGLLLALGLVFFPSDHDFWRRLHGITTEPSSVAEDKTGLCLLKMSDAQDGWLYIQVSYPEPAAVPHRAHLPGRHRSADPRQSTAGTGDRRHRRHAICGEPPSRHRESAVIEIMAPVIATLRHYLDATATPASTACSPIPSSRSWSPTAAIRRRSIPRATT